MFAIQSRDRRSTLERINCYIVTIKRVILTGKYNCCPGKDNNGEKSFNFDGHLSDDKLTILMAKV